jgi:hypothetical protein
LKTELGQVTHPGYPESWYQKVAAATGDQLRVGKLATERAAEEASKQEARQVGESLLTLLEARGMAVDGETRDRILKTEDAGQLEKWLVRAATAKSTGEVFKDD